MAQYGKERKPTGAAVEKAADVLLWVIEEGGLDGADRDTVSEVRNMLFDALDALSGVTPPGAP